MVHFASFLIASLAASAATAFPVEKRIAQTIADSTTAWVKACQTAGGADQCNTISQTAFTTLLAAGGNCDQQNSGDQMIDLAKQLNNDPEMIRLAQIFVQQPRNAPDSLQVPYCQTAPKNTELNGLFHCQFSSSDFTKFSGDQTGNVPLGLTAVNPPGSCPANTAGPVADGVQLETLVTSPGTPSGAASSSGGAGSAAAPSNVGAGSAAAPSTVGAGSAAAPSTVGAGSAAPSAAPANNAAASPAGAAGAGAASGSFTLQNGQDAQKQNAQFATLTASSSCQDGQQACVQGAFAQCVGGKFSSTPCAASTSCFALPLVNSAGTSVTCSTQADAQQRIAATGATGGVTGA